MNQTVMREINAQSAPAYLAETGRARTAECVQVRELAGGVSNIVLEVQIEDSPPFVIKQSRERLRVEREWRARLDRIWYETDTLQLLGQLLPEGTVPGVLFIDEPNYLFAMTRAPEGSTPWKTQLLAGRLDAGIAGRLGELLGAIHAGSTGRPELHGRLADRSLFDELRIDPYYRSIAQAYPQVRGPLDALIHSMARAAGELTLGDYSPKNILVHGQGLVLLDFECAHRGDSSFDVGFFLSHLMLKAVWSWESRQVAAGPGAYLNLAARFLEAYVDQRGLDTADKLRFSLRAGAHAAACLLARVDGKSPVEYLGDRGRQAVREFALRLLSHEPLDCDVVLAQLAVRLGRMQ
jgi:5-methylthioribose kinase